MFNRLPVAVAAALVAASALATAALAQDPSVPQRGQDTDPKLPPPSQQVPERVRPETDGPGGTLSDKLERSDGVLKPPGGVDPEIKTIPPGDAGSRMPVIKPPGDAK